jgi:hypothetical protein
VAHLIDSNATLWQNVQALMLKRFGTVNLKGFATHCGVGIATVQRIQAQQTSVGLAILDKIADRHGLAAWQLLVPGLDPDNPPTLQPVSQKERELYEKIMTAARQIAAEPDAGKYL